MIFWLIASIVQRFRRFRLIPVRTNPAREVLAAFFIMKSLFRSARIKIESLCGAAVGNARIKEAVMLDIAFVALGVAFLALMGVYALALRQL